MKIVNTGVEITTFESFHHEIRTNEVKTDQVDKSKNFGSTMNKD